MADGRASDIAALLAASRRLRARARRVAGTGRLPPLLFVTDPARTPAPERIAERLPAGCGIIFRAFGAADALERGRRLRRIADRRGLVLLVGADAALARAIGADGVHLPERMAHRAAAVLRSRPGWTVTAAAHSLRAVLSAARSGAHAVLLSPALPSASPSAGQALGPVRFAAIVRSSPCPVVALGGVRAATAMRLTSSGAAGLAAVEAFVAD
jgi:thiamine-phosphate pyrophosphorylase